MKQKKLKTLTTNFSINKKVVREVGESHPPAEDELSLYCFTDFDEQIGRLADTTKSPKVDFAINENDSEYEEMMKMTSSRILLTILVQWKKQVHQWEKIGLTINNVIYNSVITEKLVQELQENSLKIKKCNPEIWSEMLQSNIRSKDLKTQKMQSCILEAVGAISKVTNTLLDIKNRKNFNTTTLSKNISTTVHDYTESLALLSPVNTDPVNTAKLA